MSKQVYERHMVEVAQTTANIQHSMMNMFHKIANEHDLTQFERVTMLFKMFHMIANVADTGRKDMKKLFREATKNGN